jgi:thioredoxin 1
MKKKITLIIVLIIFISLLVLANMVLNKKQNNSKQESQKKEENEMGENKMQVITVTEKNFEDEVLKSEKTVLIDFYADWCGPCKILSPIVDEVAEENEKIKVVKINIDQEENLAVEYQILSIPTLVVIKNGKEVKRSVGVVDKEEILDLVK